MKLCSKCNQPKPEDNYYTYWHSTQKKYRTRRICQECMSKQKKQFRTKIKEEKQEPNPTLEKEKIVDQITPELTTEIFKDNPNYRQCTICQEYLEKETQFYRNKNTGYYHSMCKTCSNNKSKKATQEYFEEKRRNNGGSERVSNRPNTYQDIYQKEQTFWLMNLLEWNYDEETGIWWKEGIKDKNKNWKKIIKKVKPERPKRKIIDYEKIVDLKKRGFTNTEISDKLNYTQMTVRKYLKLYF